jgi:hypothetical protein
MDPHAAARNDNLADALIGDQPHHHHRGIQLPLQWN